MIVQLQAQPLRGAASGLLRSIGSLSLGYLASAVVVVLTTSLLVVVMFGGDWQADPTPVYLVLNVSGGFLAALFGGWVAGRVAVTRPVAHGVALGVLMLVMAVGPGLSSGTVSGYAVSLGLSSIAGSSLGGVLARRRSS